MSNWFYWWKIQGWNWRRMDYLMTAQITEIPICCCRPESQMFTRLDIGAAAGKVLSLARTDRGNQEVPGLLVANRCETSQTQSRCF